MNATALSVDQALRKAKSLARKGAMDEAEALLRQMLARFPDNRRLQESMRTLALPPGARRNGRPLPPDKANALLALFRQRRIREALALARSLLARHPQVALLHSVEAACLAESGQTDAALASYRRAIALAPEAVDMRNNMARLLMAMKRNREALEQLDAVLERQPDNLEALNNMGAVLTVLGRSQEAIAPLERALALKPDFPDALANRGNALNHVGRREEAIADLEKVVALQPGNAAAHRSLSAVKTYESGDPQIAQMEALLAAAGPAERRHLHLALAKAHDDLRDVDKAFGHLQAGNALWRQSHGDPMERHRKVFAQIRSMFEDGIPEPISPATTGKRPIFVLGMPRSGTSLVEQILASHPEVHGGGELSALRQAVMPALGEETPTPEMLQDIRRRYLGEIETLGTDRPVVTDKMPANFRWIGFIAAALPEATIIHTTRDPVAVGWSIFRTFFPAGGMEYSFDLGDIAAYTRFHDEMMAFWADRLPGRIHEINYERLTEDQEGETRRLLELCGLEWNPRCLEFHRTERVVTTASAGQVRRKMYGGSSQAWRKYEKHLRPLVAALQ
ncbi:tetratricopeptide repeat-containing sulfotransferase family protein [Oricola thermophila]|uniref:Sulfotransferase n=1 Tax=Oricola thermophila TaxID=2742145 RepID=A0A6N1VEW9_9HYPH|nr:sulfotransferase [Oricola thermophila]QKV19506.1 sulfotransferase [Oricola thermophila]